MDLARVRAAFPILDEVTYLNVGTYGLMPKPALDALLRAVAELETAGVAASGSLYAQEAEVRPRVAALLGAAPEEIAFTRNASDGISLAIAGLAWQPGDEAITSDQEHPAMSHPLAYLQRSRGVRVHQVAVSPEPEVMRARLTAVAGPRTRLVAVSQVPCETGTRLPAREVCAWAAERGILSLIDGAQALGVFPVDVRAMGCDFYTSNGHKWLGGPKGTGIFYARRDRLPDLALAPIGGGALERADLAAGLAEPWPTAQRFEYGTRAFALPAGLAASLDWLEGLGWREVERQIAGLAGYLKARVAERPYLRLLTPREWERSSGLTAFEVVGHEAGEVSRALRERWRTYVRVVTHYNALRVATAHFNSEADLDRLLGALDQIAGG